MTVKIDEKEVVTVECSDCANASLCAVNVSQVINLLQRNGITDFKLLVTSCSKFNKKVVNGGFGAP